jgi:peptidoglycan/LPS O-acetylase OafA/YrhL
VWALDSYPILQTPFKWNFSRYLGDLSFGIYVMHFPVIWTLWANIINPVRTHLFGDNLWGYAPFMILNYAAVLWAADLFIRVDQRVVAFGKWTQERLFTW